MTALTDALAHPNLKRIFLAEITAGEHLTFWTLNSGSTYYANTVLQVAGVEENGAALTSRASIALVDANPGSYFFDAAAQRVYVQCTASASPCSMYTVVKHKPWHLPYIYKRSAELHVEIHAHSISAELPSQRQILEKSIYQAEALPSHLRSKVLTMLESLPDGNQLCHGDFWGGNILLTPRGEVVIDWHNASRGNPIADLARSTIGHFGATKTRQFNRLNITYGTSKANQIKNSLLQLFARMSYPIYLYHYFKLCPGGEDEYRRWLPIVAAARLSHNIPELENC